MTHKSLMNWLGSIISFPRIMKLFNIQNTDLLFILYFCPFEPSNRRNVGTYLVSLEYKTSTLTTTTLLIIPWQLLLRSRKCFVFLVPRFSRH